MRPLHAGPVLVLAAALGALAAPAAGAADDVAAVEALLAADRAEEAVGAARALVAAAEPGPARARLRVLEARCLRAAGNPWQADAALGAALDDDPSSAEAARERGLLFLSLAEEGAREARPSGARIKAFAADAVTWLRRAGAGDTAGGGDPAVMLARAHLLGEEFAAAAEVLRAAVDRAPADASLHHALAGALRAAGDRAGAAAEEARVLALRPDDAVAAANRVGDLAAAGDVSAARTAAREALLAHPGANAIYRALWSIEAPAGRYLPLEETILSVLRRHPRHPTALYYLGYARKDGGRHAEALAAFRERLEVPPASPRARLEVARLLAGRAAFEEAEREFLAVVAEAGPDGDGRDEALGGLVTVGVRYGMEGRHEDAVRVFRRLAAESPDDADVAVLHALASRKAGLDEEAEAAYRRAVELSPFDGRPRNEYGIHLLSRGRREEAEAAFRASAEVDARLTDGLENLGFLARRDGRTADAMRHFREAHRRASAFGDEAGRLKFRRYLDQCARDAGGPR